MQIKTTKSILTITNKIINSIKAWRVGRNKKIKKDYSAGLGILPNFTFTLRIKPAGLGLATLGRTFFLGLVRSS